jgi:chaperone required for assembly of F1-ATPase
MTALELATVAGVTEGSVPEDAVAVGNAENWMESVPPTPAPVAFALITTVVPVVESTVVAAGITVGAVKSVTVMPATIHAGVAAKCKVALPFAVVEFVVTAPATCTRA